MGNLSLVRVDQRLIHGQVITSWIKKAGADKILILDNDITSDPFMKKVFLMAGPPGCKLEIYDTVEGSAMWKDGRLDTDGDIMVLFRNIPAAYDAFFKGFKFPELQVGSAGGAPGRKNVHGAITMNDAEADMLKEMDADGCRIYFQSTPDTALAEWADILAVHFS